MNENSVQVAFVDSNVWLYAFIKSQDEKKHAAARALILRCRPVISTQVINEVCVNLLKKAKFPEEQVRELILSFYEKYQIIELSRTILVEASDLRQRYSISFWDSIIVSTALQSKVPVLYSEDMQDGLAVDNRLRVVNPFISFGTTPES